MFAAIRSKSVRSIAVLLVLGCGAFAHSEDKAPEQLSSWQKLLRTHAAEYTMTAADEGQARIKLVPEPILQWSQPVRGGAEGAVFVWEREGRPMAIGTLFIWPASGGKQGVAHELHSLSSEPLNATWRDRTWTPPKNSVVWTELAEAPRPASKPEQRLRQMREAARRFSAESLNHEHRRWDLRLLPQPIYRYKVDGSAGNELLDGALFGFVEGTDLEIVLAIQARNADDGARWDYALARMSDFQMTARLGDKTVWQVERSAYDTPRAAYTCSTVEYRTSAEAP